MALKRRQLLQYSAAGSLLLALPPLQGAALGAASLRTAVMPDDSALPRFAAGQLLIADTSRTTFDADGIYFYPAWGTPRPWRVSLGHNDMLEFRNPGSGQLAWVQSKLMNPLFAGKLVDDAPPGVHRLAGLPPLQVPLLPAC